jgi:hypothetical protein
MLKDRALLDPGLDDQSPAARVYAFDEIRGEGGHLRAEPKDEGEWRGDIQKCVYESYNECRRGDREKE